MDLDDPVVETIFKGNHQLQVPSFQRHYVWGSAQHERLWGALVEQLGSKRPANPYFMGAVVLAGARERRRDSRPRRLIVDGQQRLITLQILLSITANRSTTARKRAIENLLSWYVPDNQTKTPENLLRVYPGESDRVDFFKCITEVVPDEFEDPGGAIAGAWYFFHEKVDEYLRRKGASPKRLESAILQRLRFVEIVTEGDANPQEVFETLNHDGVPLDQGDLIRNYVFMSSPSASIDRLYEDVWRPFEDRLTDREYESFLYAWTLLSPTALATSSSAAIARGNFFPVAKEALRSRTPAAMELTIARLARSGQDFADLVSGEVQATTRRERGLVHLLAELQEFSKASQPLLFLVYSRWAGPSRHRITATETLRCVRAIEAFTVRWMLGGKNQSALTPLFRSMVVNSSFREDRSSLPTAVARYLRQRDNRPSNADIRRQLLEKPFYGALGTGRQQFLVLRRLAYARQFERASGEFLLNSYDPDARLVEIQTPRWSIDHVLPQKDANWRRGLGRDLEKARELRHTIGNLCITPRNERMQNSDWATKREWYASDGMLRVNADVARRRSWTSAAIKLRSRQLTDLALRLWPESLI